MFKLVVLGDPHIEFWKDVSGYEGDYQASTYGRVRSCKNGEWHILKTGIQTHNYYNYVLMKNGIKKTYRAHRLIYETFKGPIPEGMQVNHMDENKHNNCIWNLNLLTNKQNGEWSRKSRKNRKGCVSSHSPKTSP